MTDKEIVQALRCCAEGECKDCAMHEDKQRCQEDLLDKAADLIERLIAENAALREKPPWKTVLEGNPKEKGCYLVTVKHWFDGKPVAREAFWNGTDWLSCEKRREITPRVTHWTPLPEVPEEGEKA